jgi:hypothetical protein
MLRADSGFQDQGGLAMWGIGEKQSGVSGTRAAVAVAIGVAGGLVAGVIAARNRGGVAELGSDVRDGARKLAARMGPARLRRAGGERAVLTVLEDAVIDACLEDEVLRNRGLDIGAISPGIIELSGAVATEQEADRAVVVARQVEGVTTVVNRIEVEAELAQREEIRRRREDGDPAFAESHWGGRNIGMGRMRQGGETEPPRRDDSQKLRDRALDAADRDDALAETNAVNGAGRSEASSLEASPSIEDHGRS